MTQLEIRHAEHPNNYDPVLERFHTFDIVKFCVDCYSQAHDGEHERTYQDGGFLMCPEWEGWSFGTDTNPSFGWGQCEGCHSRLGGDRFMIEASYPPAKVSNHDWQKAPFTGNVTCSKCDLLPIHDGDRDAPCICDEDDCLNMAEPDPHWTQELCPEHNSQAYKEEHDELMGDMMREDEDWTSNILGA